jgi:hypothetical protein
MRALAMPDLTSRDRGQIEGPGRASTKRTICSAAIAAPASIPPLAGTASAAPTPRITVVLTTRTSTRR